MKNVYKITFHRQSFLVLAEDAKFALAKAKEMRVLHTPDNFTKELGSLDTARTEYE